MKAVHIGPAHTFSLTAAYFIVFKLFGASLLPGMLVPQFLFILLSCCSSDNRNGPLWSVMWREWGISSIETSNTWVEKTVWITCENATGKGPELISSHEKRDILSNLLKAKWFEGRWGYRQITHFFFSLTNQKNNSTIIVNCTFPLERIVISA